MMIYEEGFDIWIIDHGWPAAAPLIQYNDECRLLLQHELSLILLMNI